jgi:hypothetical protein
LALLHLLLQEPQWVAFVRVSVSQPSFLPEAALQFPHPYLHAILQLPPAQEATPLALLHFFPQEPQLFMSPPL